MKTAVTGRLTLAYLRRLDRSTYYAAAFSTLIVTISLLWMIFQLGGSDLTGSVSNFVYPACSLLAALWLGKTAYNARYGPVRLESRHQLAWLLISLGFLCDALGGLYYAYLVLLKQDPFPSPSDIGFLLYYPLVFAGLLLMPTVTAFHKRMGLDALITALCLLGVCWAFVIGPTYFSRVGQANSPVELIKLAVSLSYPCMDIVLFTSLMLLLQRRVHSTIYPSFILFSIGILVSLWADAAFAYTCIFTMTYQSGTPFIDIFWPAGSFLIGLTGMFQYSTIARRSYKEYVQTHKKDPQFLEEIELTESNSHLRHRRIPSLSIYLPLLFLLGLTVYDETMQDGPVAHFLVLLTAVIGVLLTARFLLTTHENEHLLQEREQRREESETLRHLSTELTTILDMERLLERIVLQVTTELHYDAAMLLLKEERYRPLDQHAHILVHTALANAPGISHWRFQGNNDFYRTILTGKVVEVNWDAHQDALPETSFWQPDRQIASMLFLPLKFQEHILGSLGVARRKSPQLDQHSIAIAQTFAEQASIVIEQAHLYREAHEHETFARALANIAARLNAAVIDPSEIYQMICSEAANALRADYALLYVPHNRRQLYPLATFNTTQDQEMQPHNWPTINIDEDVSIEFQSLQPFLHQLKTTESIAAVLAASRKQQYRLATGSGPEAQRNKELELPGEQLSWKEQLTRRFIYSIIIAPLIAEGATVGILIVGRSLPPGMHGKRSLDITDLPYAQDFAEQAAVAFMNAQFYQRLRNAHQRLQEVDKLKDQFMITASHELRTPLTAVQGYIELLAHFDEMLPQEQRQEFLQKAQRSCDELVVLLGNVMDVSRLEVEAGIKPAHLEPVQVQEIINGIIDLIEPQVTQEHRTVQVQLPIPVSVQADPVRLRQVLLNISANALKYSPAGTPITFSAYPFMGRPPYVIISISDKGKGISLKDQARLFQRFVRLESDINSPIRGSGLGLYISRRLVEAMNGKIWIESRGIAGEGSTFHIQLPLAPSPALHFPIAPKTTPLEM